MGQDAWRSISEENLVCWSNYILITSWQMGKTDWVGGFPSIDRSTQPSDATANDKSGSRRDFKWTRTHGFFLQMGGFMIHEKGQEKRVLTFGRLATYYSRGRIDLSGVTEARINDHSKADGFAKGIALLQTLWFIVQCAARFSDRHLILTELELVTAALAVLSLVMYALWWNKPFNAEIPIVLTVSDTPHAFKNDGSDGWDDIGMSVKLYIIIMFLLINLKRQTILCWAEICSLPVQTHIQSY